MKSCVCLYVHMNIQTVKERAILLAPPKILTLTLLTLSSVFSG